ncbi:hypothetical protein ACFE04_031335 [Oxalis oulophora]
MEKQTSEPWVPITPSKPSHSSSLRVYTRRKLNFNSENPSGMDESETLSSVIDQTSLDFDLNVAYNVPCEEKNVLDCKVSNDDGVELLKTPHKGPSFDTEMKDGVHLINTPQKESALFGSSEYNDNIDSIKTPQKSFKGLKDGVDTINTPEIKRKKRKWKHKQPKIAEFGEPLIKKLKTAKAPKTTTKAPKTTKTQKDLLVKKHTPLETNHKIEELSFHLGFPRHTRKTSLTRRKRKRNMFTMIRCAKTRSVKEQISMWMFSCRKKRTNMKRGKRALLDMFTSFPICEQLPRSIKYDDKNDRHEFIENLTPSNNPDANGVLSSDDKMIDFAVEVQRENNNKAIVLHESEKNILVKSDFWKLVTIAENVVEDDEERKNEEIDDFKRGSAQLQHRFWDLAYMNLAARFPLRLRTPSRKFENDIIKRSGEEEQYHIDYPEIDEVDEDESATSAIDELSDQVNLSTSWNSETHPTLSYKVDSLEDSSLENNVGDQSSILECEKSLDVVDVNASTSFSCTENCSQVSVNSQQVPESSKHFSHVEKTEDDSQRCDCDQIGMAMDSRFEAVNGVVSSKAKKNPDDTTNVHKKMQGRTPESKGKKETPESRREAKSTKKNKEEKIDWEEIRKKYSKDGHKSSDQLDSIDWEALRSADIEVIAKAIKDRGMQYQLAGYIKSFLDGLVEKHPTTRYDLEWLRDIPPDLVKKYLLEIGRIGLKSAECVRLLGIQQKAFPVDTNVARIAVRLGWVPLKPLVEGIPLHLIDGYPDTKAIQEYLWQRISHLSQETLYELHYHLITFGKVFCTKRSPSCGECPLKLNCKHFASVLASERHALPSTSERQHTDPMDKMSDIINKLGLIPNANSLEEFQYKNNNVCEPIIETPTSPERRFLESDIEDYGCDEMEDYFSMNSKPPEVDKSLVLFPPEVAYRPSPKLKNRARLRTEHLVYELPDNHPLLVEREMKRDKHDDMPYLLAIWKPGESPDSLEDPIKQCNSRGTELCNNKTCSYCECIREEKRGIVRGTFMIPVRTGMINIFPLNGTYFQINEVFADHETSQRPIDVPRKWLYNLNRSTVYFGTTAMYKGLKLGEITEIFTKGYTCNKAFDQRTFYPKRLLLRFHCPTYNRNKGKTWDESIEIEGEAPAFIVDDLTTGVCNGFGFKSKANETATVIGDKKYVICGTNDESILEVEVKIFDKTSGEWIIPTVMGIKPKAARGYSAIPINEDRILIIKKGSTSDDCIWFLEVNTQYVRDQGKSLGTEVVAWSKGVLGSYEKPVVISGPSGVGKGTLINMLMKDFPSMFGFSVSHTTRGPRTMETDGVHYHFTERSVMEKEIKDGKFLEFANVHGNLYGTSIEAVEVVADSGKRCILDIDVQGARSVKASTLEAMFIFICPPSMQELEDRLRSRGTETEEQIQKRLRNAKAELEQGESSGIFGHILYNDNLEECYENLKKLLGLDGVSGVATKTLSRGIDLPEVHSVTKIENKIIINCGTSESEKAAKNLMVLDVSVLKGGSPGRTRGLNVYAVDSFSDGLNGHHHNNN